MADNAADGPRAAELRCCAFRITVLQRAPDPGGRQRTLRIRHRRNQRQPHPQRFRPRGQKAGVAAPPVSEGEILARHQMARAKPSMQHLGNEVVRRHQAEFVVERQLIQQIDAKPRQRGRPLRGQCQAERRVIGAKHLTRVRLERQHRQRGIGPCRMGGPDDAGVAQMHAVEVTERDGRTAGVGRQTLPILENPHQSRVGTRTIASPSITTFSLTKHCVRKVTLFRGRFKSVISTVAFTVWPILTGARKLNDCRR